MMDHTPIEHFEVQTPRKTTETEEEKFFVIDTDKYKEEVGRALLGMGDNTEIDGIITELATAKVKATPADAELAIKKLKDLKFSSPNMGGYIDAVAAQLTVHHKFPIQKPLKFAPTLLVGPPGCGKTYVAAKIAEAIDIWHGNISLSLATESFVLSGCPKGYSSATPGDIARRMAKSNCINPLLILDELDKACFYPRDRPALTGPLLQILEVDTATQFEDACLKCELDVSHVSWLATANDISHVPEAILSRFHVIQVQETDGQSKACQIQLLALSVVKEMGLGKYFSAEVARDALEKYLHLSIRAWKLKLQLAISLRACNSYRGDHIVIREEDMKGLVHEKKKQRIGFI